MTSLKLLKRSCSFTKYLSPDDKVPSVEAAKEAPEQLLRAARQVNGSFTWLRPQNWSEIENGQSSSNSSSGSNNKRILVGVSAAAMKDLGLQMGDENTELFQDVVSGTHIFEDTYPYAQAYAGWQFGEWAGQLGDGRAVNLFEAQNPITGKTFEVQLKGAGLTPYSRFADGKAVLRSSVREALGCEAVNALGIPSTRALSLTRLPYVKAARYVMEECAIVARMAETWIRIGTFDFHRARGARSEMRKLADYCIDHVFTENYVSTKNESTEKLNRYGRLYKEIVVRNARTVGMCQGYGFMNGVLNTDNTSIYGLALDFGPFAFMDTFDASFTPNHDDGLLRYSFKNSPSVVWWNLVRLGENLGELIGADESFIDDEVFVTKGVTKDQVDGIISRAERIIDELANVYKAEFLESYNNVMARRLGLTLLESDHDKVFTPLLDMLQECELDYNQFFRKLGNFSFDDESSLESFFPKVRPFVPNKTLEEARQLLSEWIYSIYKPRIELDGITVEERTRLMNQVNPKFVLKTWIMDKVIKGTKDGNYEMYNQVMTMALNPFNESWEFDKDFEDELTGDVPRSERDIQCSCSS
jgi:serine/tyrosine/threonine adenylyltransferase